MTVILFLVIIVQLFLLATMYQFFQQTCKNYADSKRILEDTIKKYQLFRKGSES